MRVRVDSISKVNPAPAGGRLVALDNVSLDIGGRRVRHDPRSLSGGGKSTLLQVVAGLEAPTQGRVTFDGVRAGKALTAVVFQEHALFPWRTVRENVTFGLEVRGLPPPERLAWLLGGAALLLLGLVWKAVARLGWVPTLFLPAPTAVLAEAGGWRGAASSGGTSASRSRAWGQCSGSCSARRTPLGDRRPHHRRDVPDPEDRAPAPHDPLAGRRRDAEGGHDRARPGSAS